MLLEASIPLLKDLPLRGKILFLKLCRLKILVSGVIPETWVPVLHMRSAVSVKELSLINRQPIQGGKTSFSWSRFYLRFPGGAHGKEPTCQCSHGSRLWFESWVGKISWRRAWQPTGILAWRSPWTEEPSGLQSVGSQSLAQRKRLSTQHTEKVFRDVSSPLKIVLWCSDFFFFLMEVTLCVGTCLIDSPSYKSTRSRRKITKRGKEIWYDYYQRERGTIIVTMPCKY